METEWVGELTFIPSNTLVEYCRQLLSQDQQRK
jgi:hypothetical protein